MKALIVDGRVVDIHAKEFPVAEGLIWADAPDTVRHGDAYDGQSFTRPAVVLPPILQRDPIKEIDALRRALKTKASIDITDADIEAEKESRVRP